MPASKPSQQSRLVRLRAVEELYLGGYCAMEIFELIGVQYNVSRGTVRNDIVAIRKIWTQDVDNRNEIEGKQRYMAALRDIRRNVVKGWREVDALGRVSVRGRDFKLAHNLDKEIARLSGVRLASDERTIHLDIQRAKDYMETVMTAVFKHVSDPKTQEAIIAELEALDEGAR